jgi:hypothetical protein
MPVSLFSPETTKREAAWALAVMGLILATTCAPLVLGLLATPPGKMFMWSNRLNGQDLYTYFSWMEQAARGQWLFTDRFTSEPHGSVLFEPLFLLAGLIVRHSPLSLGATYHLLRIVFALSFCVVLHRWITAVFKEPFARRVAFLLVLTSSGIGWLAEPVGLPSADLGIPETITYMALYQSPVFALSLTLMSLILIRLADPSDRVGGLALAGSSALLSWVHPFDIVTVVVVAATWTCFRLKWPGARTRLLLRLAAVIAGVLPYAIYHQVVLVGDPVFRKASEMVHAPSPTPIGYALGFGLLVPLAVAGFSHMRRSDRERSLLFAIWICATILLVYAPVSFQRRLIQGVHIPLALLATTGMTRLARHLGKGRSASDRRHLGGAIVAGLLMLLALSNMRMVAADVEAYRKGGAPYYLRLEYGEAFRWLRENTGPYEIVFCSIATGSFVPALSGNTVFIGHWGLTLSAEAKKSIVEGFFRTNENDAAKARFLREAGVRYVLFGEVEDVLGTYDPRTKGYLALRHANARVSIYEVIATS